MLQLTAGLAGGDDLTQSIRKVSDSAEKALRGYDKPQAKAKRLNRPHQLLHSGMIRRSGKSVRH